MRSSAKSCARVERSRGHAGESYRSRLRDCLARADESPLGACASTGTSLGIDRARTAAALGFARPTAHSIDSVSDRDYLMEFTFSCSALMIHLSRLSEEMILFASQEFGFLDLADAYCTGSSIMPQKKNPDVPELVRGKTATVIGEAVKLLTLMKALPLGYNKDLQEDKKAWFSALDAAEECVAIMIDVVETMRPVARRMREATRRGHLLATEYANYLVQKGLAFREAHHVVGALVREAEQRGVDLSLGAPARRAPAGIAAVRRRYPGHDREARGCRQAIERLLGGRGPPCAARRARPPRGKRVDGD